MLKRNSSKLSPGTLAALGVVLALSSLTLACGSPGAKSATTQTPAGADATSTAGGGRTPGGRFGNRTPPPDVQTSIAEGTPARGFGNRTPPPDVETAIAQGTPLGFGDRAISGAIATALAEGTPSGALRGFGVGGAGRTLAAVAGLLAIDQGQLRTELQAPGASIESVAAAHGLDRAALRQRLIDAIRQRLNDAVTSGNISQQMADDQAAQLESNIDSIIDMVGGGGLLNAPTPAP